MILMPIFLNENIIVKKFWILFGENTISIFYVKILGYNLSFLHGEHYTRMLWTKFTISLPMITILISGTGEESAFPSEHLQ